MEAWLFLWPDAAVAVNGKWKRPARTGQRVGRLIDAKEAFRRALRPSGGKRTRDYEESDSPKIAAQVRTLGLVGTLDAKSESYERFRDAVATARF